MIQSKLLDSKSGTGLLGIPGNLQKGKIEKRGSQFGLLGNPMAFFNLLKGNMLLIGGHNKKAFGGGILFLQKGLSGKEGYKKGEFSPTGIHGSNKNKEAFAHFLKSCGFNDKEIKKIIHKIRKDSGLSDMKVKTSKKGEIVNELSNIGDSATPSISTKSRGEKKNFKCISGAVMHKENGAEIEKSLSDAGTKELSNPGTEIFHKKIRPLDKLIKDNKIHLSNIGDSATPSISTKSRGEKKNFKCISGAVMHKENGAEIEKSLSDAGTKELSNPGTEIFHKKIRPLDKLINESFSGREHRPNISVSNVSAPLNGSDINPQILIQQIVKAARKKLPNGLGRVKIRLHPPHLGTLYMDVLVKDNKVHVILQTQNDSVRHILQSNMEQLKDSLHSQGLIINNINVSVQEKLGNTGYGFGQNGGLFREDRNPGENREDQRKGQSLLSHDSPILERKGLGLQKDGGISLFA